MISKANHLFHALSILRIIFIPALCAEIWGTQAEAAPPFYQLILIGPETEERMPLDFYSAVDVNNAGQVLINHATRALLWQDRDGDRRYEPEEETPLFPQKFPYARGLALNNLGQVAGFEYVNDYRDGNNGVVWENGQILAYLSQGGVTLEADLNDIGQVLYEKGRFRAHGGLIETSAHLVQLPNETYPSGYSVSLGAFAYALNNAGQILGIDEDYTTIEETPTYFLW